MNDAPADITLNRAERLLEVCWRDETPRHYTVRQLRCACACANCVDERTGARILDFESVADDVGITHMELVGNYALKFVFSDGHDTGIYSWDRLYDLPTVP